MFKKFISVLLAVMMIASVMAVGVVTGSAVTTDGFTPDPNKLYFDVDGTGWEMGTKNKIAFHIFGGDIENELAWGAKKAIGTATSGESGVFEIDPAAKLGLTLTPGVQYKIIFARTEGSNWGAQTYDLLFTTDCLGHIAYSDGNMYENPVDSSKKTLAAFWKDMDATEVGPVLQLSSIGNVVGSCVEQGKTPSSIFADFLTVVNDKTGKTSLENARKYVVDVGTKTEQELIDDIGAGLGLTKDDVKAVFEENTKDSEGNDVTTTWSYEASTLPAASTPTEAPTEAPHVHTPGEPVQENVVPASCEADGSYDEVVYCTECQAEISREQKTINKLNHNIVFVEEVPATATANGVAAHYECTNCHKLYSDATGSIEVTAESLVIKAEHARGDANSDGDVDVMDATAIQRYLIDLYNETFDEVAADADMDSEIDIIDATLIQRIDAGMTTFEEWDAKHAG